MIIGRLEAETEVFIDRLIKKEGDSDKALLYAVSKMTVESRVRFRLCVVVVFFLLLLLLCWCFMALRHILGHFGRGHLSTLFLGNLPVLSAHSLARN